MGPSPPSRLFLALTLFFTLTHATVTVYTPTQVVFTTAPAISGTPASPNRSSSRPTLPISRAWWGTVGRRNAKGMIVHHLCTPAMAFYAPAALPPTFSEYGDSGWERRRAAKGIIVMIVHIPSGCLCVCAPAAEYPRDNCAAMYGGPGANVTDPQSVLPLYLTHDAHTELLAAYLNSTVYAQSKGKPSLMFETNTASCGGFLGISDSFTAVLWGLDYALQMAHSNFSGAMFHLGGQNVFYNVSGAFFLRRSGRFHARILLGFWVGVGVGPSGEHVGGGRDVQSRPQEPRLLGVRVHPSCSCSCFLPADRAFFSCRALSPFRRGEPALDMEQKRRDALTGCALVVLPQGVRARGSLFLPFERSLCHEKLFRVFYGNKASDHDLAGTSKLAAAEASFIAAGLVVATVAVLARAL
ncbi:hypothetical protein B0H16DRAFT_1893699 [Mycena metata]|uniref:Uncharacterized protein n=1 Tax=Mycena metata TaxID=1033252 RepID=A0AAD7HY21_9AGAR|nr:hypothetical protein B0H16DRAFT_1893699 [Mycena metata]